MKSVSITNDENVIVGFETCDDAGVYRLTDDIALVQTLDFITPIADDPFTYGQIAACNSLSDIYAMGGRPLTALNIVCFPTKKFSLDILSRIINGGLSILKKCGVQLLGGHSVEDEEMKYGLSVTGIVHPEKVIKNNGLMDGDVIILTKPLGTGIIGTAVKAGTAEEDVLPLYIKSMTTPNDKTCKLMKKYNIHACTDVTGFGLAGHLKEMLCSDNIEITVESKKLPLLPGAVDNASMGLIPGGMYRNRDYIGDLCNINKNVKQELADIIFDPQTSGGLLIGLSVSEASKLISELHSNGIQDAGIIANVKTSNSQKIIIV